MSPPGLSPLARSPSTISTGTWRRTCCARRSERVDDVDHGPQVALAVAGELEADPRKFGVVVLAQLDLRDKRAVDHPLGPRHACIGRLDRRLRHHLVGHHAGGQHNADGAGKPELVADTIELDHSANPDPQ